MKSISARHGIPEEIGADNQAFGSYAFRQFAKSWGINVTTSSPTNAQSHGQAERAAVETIMSLLKKADAEGRDPYIAMLEYRNTPISGLRYAPAQLAMSRLLRSKLQISRSVLQPHVVNAKPDLQERQQRMKRDYDRVATSLKPLTSGDVVRVQRQWDWDPAIVQYTHESSRPYVVRHEGGEQRRNRRHLRRIRDQLPLFLPEVDGPCTGVAAQPSRRAVAQPPPAVVAQPSRSVVAQPPPAVVARPSRSVVAQPPPAVVAQPSLSRCQQSPHSRREVPSLSRCQQSPHSRREEPSLSRCQQSLLSRREESLLSRREVSSLSRREESSLSRRQQSLLSRREESLLSRR